MAVNHASRCRLASAVDSSARIFLICFASSGRPTFNCLARSRTASMGVGFMIKLVRPTGFEPVPLPNQRMRVYKTRVLSATPRAREMWYRAWESNPLLRDYETLTMPYRSARCVRVVELFSPSKQIPDRPKPQNTFWLRFDHTNRHGNLADRTIRRVTDARHRAAIGQGIGDGVFSILQGYHEILWNGGGDIEQQILPKRKHRGLSRPPLPLDTPALPVGRFRSDSPCRFF